MRRDKLQQTIGTLPSFAHVVVVQQHDIADLRQSAPFQCCIQGCDEGAPAPGAKEKKRFHLMHDVDPLNRPNPKSALAACFCFANGALR